MTKYRPVEGRSIEDVKAGDLISCRFNFADPWTVIGVNSGVVWSRCDADGHRGALDTIEELIKDNNRIVEPIPEPVIEKACVHVDEGAVFNDPSCYRNVIALRLTRTDGKITAVELVKDEGNA